MGAVLLALLKRPVVWKIALALCLVPVLLAAGFGVYRYVAGPVVKIVEHGIEKIVTIEKPVLKYRDVIKYVTDKEAVERLLAENGKLKTDVTALNETVAELLAKGYGKIKYLPDHTGQFQDWRLTFTFDKDANASYELHQQFRVLAYAGKTFEGKPTVGVKLFEVGPGDLHTELTTVKSDTIVASPGTARWFVSPTLQAGAALSGSTPGVVVGAQWLRRGTSTAAEDGSLSLLTPAVFLSGTRKEIGLLPVSYNVGRKLPGLKDVWVSPYIGGSGKFGVSVTASF